MAADMTAGAQTPYEKTMAILHELHRGYRYNLEVAPQQGNMDFVSTFLMQTREGYCTHFASAMTVLCRMVGLPARYVEGYVAVPDGNGNALVTGKQGHAWTEVYFEGFGWLTFDPTPTQEHMQAPPEQEEQEPPEAPLEPENNTPPEEPESPETPPEEEPPKPPEEDESEPEAQEPNLSWLWWLLVLLLLTGAGLRIWWILPQQQEKRCTQEQAQFAVWMQAIHDVLLVHGQMPESNESPTAFLLRVDTAGLFSVSLLPIGKVASMVAYGKINPT